MDSTHTDSFLPHLTIRLGLHWYACWPRLNGGEGVVACGEFRLRRHSSPAGCMLLHLQNKGFDIFKGDAEIRIQMCLHVLDIHFQRCSSNMTLAYPLADYTSPDTSLGKREPRNFLKF